MKKFKILSELSFGGSMGGDIYFFDKNIFDKFIKKKFKKKDLITKEKISKILSSNDYLRFNRTSLFLDYSKLYGNNIQKQDTLFIYDVSDVKIIAKYSTKKINELFITTTNLLFQTKTEKVWLDENNFAEILEMTNYNTSKKKSLGKIDIKSGNMVVFCVKSVSDLLKGPNQSYFSLKVPNGTHKLFQCFDKTYKYNLSSERNYLKRYNQLQIRIKKRSNNLKGTDVNQWEEDDKEISNWNWKDSLPKNPNIHFLYFHF